MTQGTQPLEELAGLDKLSGGAEVAKENPRVSLSPPPSPWLKPE